MADSDLLCKIPYKGDVYELHPRDITVGRLRQMKQWYGREYGSYVSFVNMFLQGDADAVACALWLVLSKRGGNVPSPQNIDFAPFEIYKAINEANEAKLRGDDDEDDQAVNPTSGVVETRDGSEI